MPKIGLTMVTGLAIIFLILASCRTAPAPAPKAATPAPAAPTPKATPAPSPEELAWQQVIEAAKKEGEVNFYGSVPSPAARDALAKVFKDKYGIKVNYVPGRAPELQEKVATEQRTKVYVADVFSAGNVAPNRVKQAGFMVPTDIPALKESGAFLDSPKYLDPEGYFVTYQFLWLVTEPFINTKLVSPEPQSYQDLLDPKFKGKIVIDDPTVPGPGRSWLIGMLTYGPGEEYLAKLAALEPKLMSGAWLEEVNTIVKGEYSILLGSNNTFAIPAINEGVPVKPVQPKEGLFGMSSSIGLIKNAPHPNAAQLLMNYMLAKEGQEIMSRAEGVLFARKDLSYDWVVEAFRLKPTIKRSVLTLDDLLKDDLAFSIGKRLFKK